MGMLKNLGASIKGRLGLSGGDTKMWGHGVYGSADFIAEMGEHQRLLKIERKKKAEARFFDTEGAGKRRFAKLSLGNEEELDELSEGERSQRATGRFADDRLVL